jgi:hypothetical protein
VPKGKKTDSSPPNPAAGIGANGSREKSAKKELLNFGVSKEEFEVNIAVATEPNPSEIDSLMLEGENVGVLELDQPFGLSAWESSLSETRAAKDEDEDDLEDEDEDDDDDDDDDDEEDDDEEEDEDDFDDEDFEEDDDWEEVEDDDEADDEEDDDEWDDDEEDDDDVDDDDDDEEEEDWEEDEA